MAKAWSKEVQPKWNAAALGSSALFEVYGRILGDEAASLLKASCLSGFLDIAKFYDSVDWFLVIEAGLALHFPAPVLALELQLCFCLLIFKYNGAVSEGVEPTKSLIAGGRDSGRFALAVLPPPR